MGAVAWALAPRSVALALAAGLVAYVAALAVVRAYPAGVIKLTVYVPAQSPLNRSSALTPRGVRRAWPGFANRRSAAIAFATCRR